MIHQFEQLRIFAEEMFARVAARLDDVFLVIAVHTFFHALEQQAGLVAPDDLVPFRAPNHLDDIPARAVEHAFKFLDNFSVAAHRPVEPLQIAIHHPDEVVKIFARCECDRAERFGFVRFAVAEERPDLRLFLPVHETARLQVTVEPRLIQRHDRAEAHRDRRKLPEIRHPIWMGIRRQPAALGQFLPEILQMLLVQPAFEKSARIHSGRGVPLEINEVARKIFRASAEKMILRHLVKRRRRCERPDVSAHVRRGIRLHHHRHRVPADDALDAAFDVAVAGKCRLLLRRNRVDVRRGQTRRRARRGAQLFRELFEQLRRALRPLALQRQFKNRLQRLRPFVVVAGGCGRAARTVNFFF